MSLDELTWAVYIRQKPELLLAAFRTEHSARDYARMRNTELQTNRFCVKHLESAATDAN